MQIDFKTGFLANLQLIRGVRKKITTWKLWLAFWKLWHLESRGFLHFVLHCSLYDHGVICTRTQSCSIKINKQRKNRNDRKTSCLQVATSLVFCGRQGHTAVIHQPKFHLNQWSSSCCFFKNKHCQIWPKMLFSL